MSVILKLYSTVKGASCGGIRCQGGAVMFDICWQNSQRSRHFGAECHQRWTCCALGHQVRKQGKITQIFVHFNVDVIYCLHEKYMRPPDAY